MDKIKVFYDYQIMLQQKFGGISRYFYELFSRINQMEDIKVDAYCYGNRNAYFEKYFGSIKDRRILGMGFLNRFLMPKKMKGYDIIHPTYYHPYILKCKYKKLVITVYDMIHELFPDMFPAEDPTKQNKKIMMDAADHIIAISESTKRDILKLYPDIPSKKISVIYIAGNLSTKIQCANLNLPEKYILFVGNRGIYKNFKAFFNSIEPILIKDTNLHLVCIGGGPFDGEEREMIDKVSNRVIQMNAHDSELAYAYSKAICFIFPSLYEGFGIPTLEAFGCNCPVVLSNTSSMLEVGGDAAIYFDPYNQENMREKIEEVIYDTELREQMKARGQIQFSKFNWDSIVQETVSCYKNVLGEAVRI